MYSQAEKPKENKSSVVANAVSQRQNSSENTFQFVDNRPEAIQMRKLQEKANNSPQVTQLRAFQSRALANSVAQKKSNGKQGFGFEDNRPEMIAQRKLQEMANIHSSQQQQPIQKKENNTGLPDNLKSGIENLSGYSMDDVKVHYNSNKPAQLQAYAYAQGTDIHLGSGQEKHLPHEAWHVVQQKQGKVKPTMQMKGGVNVNDDAGLEKEADVMGAKSIQSKSTGKIKVSPTISSPIIQRSVDSDLEESKGFIESTMLYQGTTNEKVSNYATNIKTVNDLGTEEYMTLAGLMSKGLKIWAQNYYNKSQAYLYEGQKANDFTNPGVNPSTFAILGSDTDLNADMEVHTKYFNHEDGSERGWSGGIAHELKASTSENYGAVYSLVQAGLDQLKKRENQMNMYGEAFQKLLLTVHNDDPQNVYPFTNNMVMTKYGGNINIITKADWNYRLKDLLTDSIATKGITTLIEIRMEHNGTRYATATFNG